MILHQARCKCSSKEARADVQAALEGIGVAKYANQSIVTLSGGNCRKLSVAATMLPRSRILVFDEPSTGMDPMTRRLMWREIEEHKPGRCILLTTHSMEEAEAVSDSIAIIAHGELQCIGSVQHLRAKYNQNYHLSIDLSPNTPYDSTPELVKAIVGDNVTPQINPIPLNSPPLPGSISGVNWKLVEVIGTRRTYELLHVPAMSLLFRQMEQNKESFGIQSYSLAQASLEDIFLQLVRREEQGEATRIAMLLTPTPVQQYAAPVLQPVHHSQSAILEAPPQPSATTSSTAGAAEMHLVEEDAEDSPVSPPEDAPETPVDSEEFDDGPE